MCCAIHQGPSTGSTLLPSAASNAASHVERLERALAAHLPVCDVISSLQARARCAGFHAVHIWKAVIHVPHS